MNNQRRKQIIELSTRLSDINSTLEDIKSEIETIRDEEQEYFDNMPESLQGGDRGSASELSISSLDDVISALETAFEEIDLACNHSENSTN